MIADPTRLEPIIGRDVELAAITDALDRLRRHQPCHLEFVGEAGIGKTTLVRALMEQVSAFDGLVLHGRASQFERDLPFASLAAALDGHDHGLGDDAGDALRHVTHRAVRDLLERLGRERRVALVLDDLHWADGATLDLLAALVERPPRGPVMIVLAYRPHQTGTALPSALTTAAARGVVRRIEPRPLDLAATAELLGQSRSTEQLSVLHRACGGNPYLMSRYAQAAPDALLVARSSELPAEAGATPESVVALVQTELGPLPASARALLESAAVLGDPFDLDLAASVAGICDEKVLAAAIDAVTSADLVRHTRTPRRLRFRHPLIRQAIHDAMPAGQRLLAHKQAARIQAAAGSHPAVIAHHLVHAAQPGDRNAIDQLTVAGRSALVRAPASATLWLDAAWQLLTPETRTIESVASLLYARSIALALSGRSIAARDAIDEILATTDPASPWWSQLQLGAAGVDVMAARYAGAEVRLRDTLRTLQDPNGIEALQVRLALASCLMITGRRADAAAVAEHASVIAEALAIPAFSAARDVILGAIAIAAGDLEETERRTDDAAAAFDAMPDEVVVGLLDQFCALVRLEWALGRLDDAGVHAHRAMRCTADGLRPILAVQVLTIRSGLAVLAGDLRVAEECATGAVEEAGLLTNAQAMYWAQSGLAVALRYGDRLGRAIEAGMRAVEEARAFGSPTAIAWAGEALARALLADGQWERAAAVVISTHGGETLPNVFGCTQAAGFALLGQASLGAGDVDAAEGWAARARAAADAAPRWVNTLPALLIEAECARARGDSARALGLVERALEISLAAGAVLPHAECELLAGRILAADGRREEATTTLRAAEATFARTGARRLRVLAQRELRQLGRRVVATGRPVGAPTLDAELTPRQRQITDLAVQGVPNKEIAAQLFLSLKTVESHLSASFAKLGVTSRAQLRHALRSHPDA